MLPSESFFFIIYPEAFNLGPAHFIYPLVIFLSGFLLFWIKLMRGGDGKFLTSLFLVLPTNLQPIVFESLIGTVLLVGGFLVLFSAVQKKIYDCRGIKDIFFSSCSFRF